MWTHLIHPSLNWHHSPPQMTAWSVHTTKQQNPHWLQWDAPNSPLNWPFPFDDHHYPYLIHSSLDWPHQPKRHLDPISLFATVHFPDTKTDKALNLLRVVSGTKWGTDEKTLIHLYCALSNLNWTVVLLYTALLASHIFKCWSQYRITFFAFVLEHFEHPRSQAYMWKQMKCLWNWGGEGLLLRTVWKWALTLLILLSVVFSANTLLHSFIDILVKYAVWASMSALICMPFILYKRICFQLLFLHTVHGFTLNVFVICLLISIQNLTLSLKFSKVTSWQFATNY